MNHITISSMFITLITSACLIMMLNHLLVNKRSYKKFRLDFLSILIIITILRLCFPSERFYTITIEVPLIMNPIADLFKFEFTQGITILNLALFIWIIGCIFKSVQLFKQIRKTNYLYDLIKKTGIEKKIEDFIPHYNGKEYPIFISEAVPSPMVFLFKKAILIPNIEYTDIEISNILHHEISHLNYHDAIIKRFLQVLTILYWWFPLIYVLEKQINLYLEMRVDSIVVKNMTNENRLKYFDSLVTVKRKSLQMDIFPFTEISSFTIFENRDILKFRIEFSLEGEFKNRTKKSFLYLLIALCICSHLVVFEPAYGNEPFLRGTLGQDEIEYLKHIDGKYYLVLKDGTITDELKLENPESSGLKIVEE